MVGASINLAVPRQDLVPALSIASTREGTFEAKPYYQWHLYSILGESWPVQGTVQISAPGYLPYMRTLTWPQTGPRTQDLGTIRLAPTP